MPPQYFRREGLAHPIITDTSHIMVVKMNIPTNDYQLCNYAKEFVEGNERRQIFFGH